MAKKSARKPVRSRSKKVVRRSAPVSTSLLSSNAKSWWGKDQPMIVILSAGIILFIVLGLFLSGWL
ncbi:MAG: hypothetical protein ABI758_03930 [Candidatus Woesebacteria bacterium]